MKTESINKSYEVDELGYLIEYQTWDENFSVLCAKQDEIKLTDKHWSVIYFLRDYYDRYYVTPWFPTQHRRIVIKAMRIKWKLKSNSEAEEIFTSLFPYHSMSVCGIDDNHCETMRIAQDIRYAGLPKPNA